ncbi:MAG: LamG domain-containing protein [Candidatus Hydrothermae bacterium]|nr:LamG domain-containing protein [Candidatus Hydrothermae bacterium]
MRFKRALRFDGVDDYVYATLSSAPNSFTISVFAVSYKVSKEGHLAEFRNTQFWVRQILGTTAWSDAVGTTTIKKNQMIHAVCVRDVISGEVRLYLNGELDGIGTELGTNPTNEFYVGAIYTLNPKYAFGGLIYMVHVYDDALTDSEIKYLYYNPFDPPRQDNLVLWLTSGSIDPVAGKWYDLSGNGNHGTIYGAQLVELEEEVIVK